MKPHWIRMKSLNNYKFPLNSTIKSHEPPLVPIEIPWNSISCAAGLRHAAEGRFQGIAAAAHLAPNLGPQTMENIKTNMGHVGWGYVIYICIIIYHNIKL